MRKRPSIILLLTLLQYGIWSRRFSGVQATLFHCVCALRFRLGCPEQKSVHCLEPQTARPPWSREALSERCKPLVAQRKGRKPARGAVGRRCVQDASAEQLEMRQAKDRTLSPILLAINQSINESSNQAAICYFLFETSACIIKPDLIHTWLSTSRYLKCSSRRYLIVFLKSFLILFDLCAMVLPSLIKKSSWSHSKLPRSTGTQP